MTSTLSHELRFGTGEFLAERRAIVNLSLIASASMALITLYQVGIIKHIPEPALPMLDAEKVNGSEQAYAKFAVPDAFLGVASLAATATLAAMGGTRRSPLLAMAMAAKIGFDAANAAKLTLDQWTKHRAFCLWCLIAAGATFAMVPRVLPELRAAIRTLRRRPVPDRWPRENES